MHDDLPALDDDDLRRGQPSAHVRFGEDVAILAGDALLAEAFRLALRYPSPDVARELAEATLGMIGGQYLDVTIDGGLDRDGLRRLHALKTGRLLRAGVTTATAVAGLSPEAEAPWRAFGDELGVLFQIVDDILDATGTAEELGKTPGKDEAAGKVTYVSLHGLEQARELADEARARVERAPREPARRHDGPGRARRHHPRPPTPEMLHRPSSAGTIVVGQPAHAWLSGQIARAWADPFEPREEVCLAADQHDIAWTAWER